MPSLITMDEDFPWDQTSTYWRCSRSSCLTRLVYRPVRIIALGSQAVPEKGNCRFPEQKINMPRGKERLQRCSIADFFIKSELLRNTSIFAQGDKVLMRGGVSTEVREQIHAFLANEKDYLSHYLRGTFPIILAVNYSQIAFCAPRLGESWSNFFLVPALYLMSTEEQEPSFLAA